MRDHVPASLRVPPVRLQVLPAFLRLAVAATLRRKPLIRLADLDVAIVVAVLPPVMTWCLPPHAYRVRVEFQPERPCLRVT